jgi:uncharacterized NAD(P)/FAD-binding protein YdhS
LRITAGRIVGGFACGDAVDVHYRQRGDDASVTLRTSRVVNCTGPATGLGTVTDPLISSLVRDGTVRPDALRLGLDVTASGAVRGRNGAVSRHVFAVGPLTRAAFWEITAVPDIRKQSAALASHLAGLLRVRDVPPRESLLYA